MRLFALLFLALLLSFSAQAHVSLTSPTGGESFTPGQTIKITWKETVPHDTENWDLYFSKDGGTTYEPLQLNIDVKILEYEWVIPTITTDKGRIKVVQDNKGGDYSDESAFFSIKSTQTALGTDKIQNDFVIYPNPVTDVFYVKYTKQLKPQTIITVSDPMGRLMYSYRSQPKFPGSAFQVDASEWPAGVYWIAIESGNAIETRKILKQ